MNKTIIGGVIALFVIVLGGWWFVSSQSSEEGMAMKDEKMMTEKKDMMPKADDSMMKKDGAMMAQETAMMAKPEDAMMKKDDAMVAKPAESMMMGGQYALYDASKVAFAKEGKVVLFFRASWCPSCRALDSDIKANLSMIPKDVLILDVDYDTSAELKKRHGVTYQHTLVQVDAEGKQLAKWSGSAGLKELLMQVK